MQLTKMFKKDMDTFETRLPINSCYKCSFFPRYFYIKEFQPLYQEIYIKTLLYQEI